MTGPSGTTGGTANSGATSSSTFDTIGQALAAGQHDPEAQHLGGLVIADTGNGNYRYYPTPSPNGPLADICHDAAAANGQIMARWQFQNGRWFNLTEEGGPQTPAVVHGPPG